MSADPTRKMAERAASFGVGGADYERFRPGFPPQVVPLIAKHLRLGPQALTGPANAPLLGDALDLGAGSGKLTEVLAPHTATLTAVDPSASMLHALEAKALPGVRTHRGTAEEIPCADASVDLVTVAQAFHWFDRDRAAAEIARVLRPGGLLALLWNGPAPQSPWDAEAHAWFHRGRLAQDTPQWGSPAEQAREVRDHVGELPGFAHVEAACLEWSEPLTVGHYTDRWRTVSTYLVADAEERQRLERGLDTILGRHGVLAETGRVLLHHRTDVLILRSVGAP